MKHLLCFGFGFSAQALTKVLRDEGSSAKISATSRSDEGLSAIEAQGVAALRFENGFQIPDDVTHVLVSAPPSESGDPVLQMCGDQLCARVFEWVGYLSTTGVYGDHQGAWVDEETPLTPNSERGRRRVDAEAAWLELHQRCGLPVHIFRLAGIYGPGRNVLENLRDGTAKRTIKPGQVFSRIHVDDIAGIVRASIARPNPGRAYNVADDEPCPPQDVVTYGAELLGMMPPPKTPFDQATLSPMAASFFADSKRVRNDRVKNELGYAFKFPDFRRGLNNLKLVLDKDAL
jgi:nucleoside-diphosphate-sugar epimerase